MEVIPGRVLHENPIAFVNLFVGEAGPNIASENARGLLLWNAARHSTALSLADLAAAANGVSHSVSLALSFPKEEDAVPEGALFDPAYVDCLFERLAVS